MDPLRNRVERESLEDLIDTCCQVAHDCMSIANSLNTAPVTLSALAKETRAVTDALNRLSELNRRTIGNDQDLRATSNEYMYCVSRDVHELRASLRRIRGPDRDSGIVIGGEPTLIIVWNEPGLKQLLGRLHTHQASLHTLLNTAIGSEYDLEDDPTNRRVIEPDVGIDQALRKLGRRFTISGQQGLVLPRVSDSADIQVLLDTLVPPPGTVYKRTIELAQNLHYAIDRNDEDAVFQMLLDRVDPNITLPGSMISPLHRAFDQKSLLISAFLAVAGADVDEPTNDGETALMRGIKCGFSEQFATLAVYLGARIDAVDNDGRSALHHSAGSNVLEDETLPVLIRAGANLDLTDYQGQTALLVAMQHGRWHTATKLVQAGANLEVRLADGKTALHLAISLRNQEFTQTLISRGANVDRVLREHTPLTMAISSRCTGITSILIDSGADLNLSSRNGNTPLLAAASTGHEETIRYLIANGADLSASTSQSGYTAMHMAAHKDKAHILRYLIASGAAIDPLDSAGETPLLIAAKLGNNDGATTLVNLGAEYDHVGPDGMSVLAHAVKAGKLELVNLLLERGAGQAPVEISTSMEATGYVVPEPQTTPMHLAAQHGHDAILLRLVSRGGALESTVFPGQTPLFVAAANGHLSTVQLLLRLGANAQARTAHGDTLLFVASGNQATLKMLLAQGIDINQRNDKGATALHYAALRGHVGGVKLLLGNGARQFHANAVWDSWEDRDNGGDYRQGTPAGLAMQRGLNKVAEMIEGWKDGY
ncbi:hypothetical protein G7046_g2099 [Stylonectria norvegica]|nr:hypothetical protein G7046_g2099 [Stylonectria norvegica]